MTVGNLSTKQWSYWLWKIIHGCWRNGFMLLNIHKAEFQIPWERCFTWKNPQKIGEKALEFKDKAERETERSQRKMKLEKWKNFKDLKTIAKKINEKYFSHLLSVHPWISVFLVFLSGSDLKLTENILKNPTDSNQTRKMVFWYLISTVHNNAIYICKCLSHLEESVICQAIGWQVSMTPVFFLTIVLWKAACFGWFSPVFIQSLL